jgi:hypothetical protein
MKGSILHDVMHIDNKTDFCIGVQDIQKTFRISIIDFDLKG